MMFKNKTHLLILLSLFTFALLAATACADTPPKTNANGIPNFAGDTVTTKSGLRYIDAVVGEGKPSTSGDKVTVHYTGWLTNGDKFDSSKDRGQAFTVTIGQHRVIEGWEEGLQGIAKGGKRILIIPANLGYGDRAAGSIPPGSTLIFEVDMLKIEEGRKPPAYKEEDVRTTASGLKYVVLHKGEGDPVQKGQTVQVHYTGWLTDGTLFDSSVDRGQLFEFVLGAKRVIAGWDEGVGLMNIGDKYLFIIPPELGYGERGAGGVIPPNATLLFEVELFGVKN